MRAKRSKKYRKIMQQYNLTFGFREPYQVLVDSHHLRLLHAFKMPLHRYLEKTLHGKVKPFITKCTLASILGTTDLHTSRRPDFLPPPLELPLRHCSHGEIEEGNGGGVLPEEECLLDLLSGGVTGNQQPKNKQHFVLATADAPGRNDESRKREVLGKVRRPVSSSMDEGIRMQAREIPGVPIIYVKRSVMILEELSGASLGVRRREEKDKFRDGLLGMESRKRKRDEDEGGDNGDNKENGGEVEAAAPKKKKAKGIKGPNPLSVLKKKSKPMIQPRGALTDKPTKSVPPKVRDASTEEGQPKAKRRRKHGKKGKSDAAEGADKHDILEVANGVEEG
ncbi:hypothetical protein EPUS_00849 [Endocarpon pusillum Z07020]|uniref:UTP23 sensor motif region domain-containing protein n=1 Tax=Endocarpon pusillum (strain Z07020 / HMAS-L-300199) TaxID=1263415 RepID=U1GNT7_ENDPU|nr:uncharacterized protein EPUS_00849 [Endocarpon pusillum Z07020]ERF73596.1 hypothetical protein EPUS_00849 [Endocarpon pusillum Z07020]